MVLKTLKENGERATKLIRRAVTLMAQEDWTSTIDELSVSRYYTAYSLYSIIEPTLYSLIEHTLYSIEPALYSLIEPTLYSIIEPTLYSVIEPIHCTV